MHTIHEAARLQVLGWVRNEDDGSVVIEAQGDAEKVERLLEWARRGPPSARVIRVEIEWIAPQAAETSFRIRH